MIDAATGIGDAVEVTDLNLVEAAAPRLRAESAEERLIGFQRLDGNDLSAAPPTAQRDLVLVGGPPALQGRRSIEHSAGLSGRATFPRRSRREWLLSALRISLPKHSGTLGGSRAASIDMRPADPDVPQPKRTRKT